MRTLFIAPAVALVAAVACGGPQAAPAPEITQAVYRLYDGPAPGSEDWDWDEYKYVDERGKSTIPISRIPR